MEALQHILTHKLIAILRGAAPADVLKIAEALFEGGIRCLEITLNSPGALWAIETIATEMEGRLLIGAGTVLNAEGAKNAISAGATFIISPITDMAVIKATKDLGVVSIPGAFTPTEICLAHSLGGDIIKVFPSTSGPAFIKEVLAPLPHLRLMPTGGISLENFAEYQKSGAVAFGLGKALVDTKRVADEAGLQQIIMTARRFVELTKSLV